MSSHAVFLRNARAVVFVLSLCAVGPSALSNEATITRTNWVERWITNLIEIRMPLNRFINEYHTNWVTELKTNVINVYATNRVARTLTNHFLVDAFRTNFVTAYQTNWKTLHMTNWQAAIVMQTNWVTEMVTNVVQIDLPSPPAPAAAASRTEAAPQKETTTETSASLPPVTTTCPVVLEAGRTARAPNKGQVEVQLKVRGNGAPSALLQVQQWRVEREDRAILCFGQDQEFRRELPVGRYKVEVKVRQDEDGAVLSVRGALIVSPREVLIEQNLAAKK
jgi:hypothetical protein